MMDEQRVGRWFLGGTIAFPTLVYLFTAEGLRMLDLAGMRVSGGIALIWPWLGVGLVAAGALFFVAVSRWNAPTTLWYVALAFAVLHVLAPLFSVPLMLRSEGLFTPLQLFIRFVQIRTPYLSIWLYAASPVAYLAVAVAACRMGALAARRRHA